MKELSGQVLPGMKLYCQIMDSPKWLLIPGLHGQCNCQLLLQ